MAEEEKYKEYKGTQTQEYNKSLKQEQAIKATADAELAKWRIADDAALLANKNYAVNSLATNRDRALADAQASYEAQRGNPGSATAEALMNTGRLNSRGAANQSFRQGEAANLQQWAMNQADLRSRYAQMGYQNTQNMYQRANDNSWKQYQTNLDRDDDLWGRKNTKDQQKLAQSNADREYAFQYEQFLADIALQQQEIDAAKAAAASSGGSGGGSGGYGSSGSGTPDNTKKEYYLTSTNGVMANGWTKLTEAEALAAAEKGVILRKYKAGASSEGTKPPNTYYKIPINP